MEESLVPGMEVSHSSPRHLCKSKLIGFIACFNASTGDIENAPAIDALPCFKLSEKNGGVYISGEKETIKGSRRKPNVKCAAAGQEKVVIVGGGSGSIGALETLRET